MKEYSLYVPANHKDGSPVGAEELTRLRQGLLDHFGEFSEFPQHAAGAWSVGPVTVHGDMLLFRMFASKAAPARRFLTSLKKELQQALGREDVVVVEAEVSSEGVPAGERV